MEQLKEQLTTLFFKLNHKGYTSVVIVTLVKFLEDLKSSGNIKKSLEYILDKLRKNFPSEELKLSLNNTIEFFEKCIEICQQIDFQDFFKNLVDSLEELTDTITFNESNDVKDNLISNHILLISKNFR